MTRISDVFVKVRQFLRESWSLLGLLFLVMFVLKCQLNSTDSRYTGFFSEKEWVWNLWFRSNMYWRRSDMYRGFRSDRNWFGSYLEGSEGYCRERISIKTRAMIPWTSSHVLRRTLLKRPFPISFRRRIWRSDSISIVLRSLRNNRGIRQTPRRCNHPLPLQLHPVDNSAQLLPRNLKHQYPSPISTVPSRLFLLIE